MLLVYFLKLIYGLTLPKLVFGIEQSRRKLSALLLAKFLGMGYFFYFFEILVKRDFKFRLRVGIVVKNIINESACRKRYAQG